MDQSKNYQTMNNALMEVRGGGSQNVMRDDTRGKQFVATTTPCRVAAGIGCLLMVSVIVLLVVVGGRGGNADSQTMEQGDSYSSTSSTFDFYVIAMSWQAQYCYEHDRYSNKYPGCQDPRDEWKTSWTIHGLWPQYQDGSWPSSCSTERVDASELATMTDDLELYWPNVKGMSSSCTIDGDCVSSSNYYYSFWQYEWSKHGTCSGLSQTDYFGAALDARLATPEIVQEAAGGTVSRQDLYDAMDYDVVLRCNGAGYLEEVRGCVSLTGVAIDCPSDELSQSNCGSTVKLASF